MRYYEPKTEWGKQKRKLTSLEFREWSQNNTKRYIIKISKRNKDFITYYKRNKKCHFCLESDIRCLEFHHKNEDMKKSQISNYVYKPVSIYKLKKEIKKCIIVCKNCHTKIHSFSPNHMEDGVLENLIIDINNSLKKDITKTERKKLHNKKQKYKTKIYIRDYKKNNYCMSCKENDILCLIFHHRENSLKKGKVSSLIKNGIKYIKEEISKCDILCHNCHSKTHHS